MIHQQLDVMERFVDWWKRQIPPPGVIDAVFGSVPPAFGEVQPAAKRDPIINDYDFLVVRGAKGMVTVHVKMDAPMGSPTELENRQQLTIQRIDHGKIPHENIDMQIRGASCFTIQEIAELCPGTLFNGGTQERYPAVDIPAGYEDQLLRPINRFDEGRKVVGTIDQNSCSFGFPFAPTGPAFDKQRILIHAPPECIFGS